MSTIAMLKDQFKNIFNKEAERVFFAPGRINLIGEHTDYNGGHVFPCSITLGTYAVVSFNNSNKCSLYSMNFENLGKIEIDLNNLDYKKEDNWTNYVKGMIQTLKNQGHTIDKGMDILFFGEIPNGAGLSSSASIELVSGVLLRGMFNLDVEMLDLIKAGKAVENNYIGVNSGIMDQFAIGMGKKDCAILLDCNTLEFSYAPVKLDAYDIIIMNTNKRRELADSKYNERRAECEEALRIFKTKLDINSLGELDAETFEANKSLIADEVILKRAKHAVYENIRTVNALEELNKGNLEVFGKLINESHISLKNDYEVTGKELDTLAETAWKQEGILGARMTGAGFGGCAIAIVKKTSTEEFIKNVGEVYLKEIGYKADFYIANIGDGAKEVK
ncbi:galactokinase [Inconstantimicrobium mannanitabidum]|uniref:Galactokinase n=1 Tax=Inconstantimicrobium mannanitabidum TaxID=1604901 RepID=A0ACB5R9R0_9CLOT|nr:galactokinase [Clostridium sp. TW13]GKX65771.1 galactokinase [Clostridium sp. TW13]